MPTKDIKALEKKWEQALEALEERRKYDARVASAKKIATSKKIQTPLGAYLTPEILARRQELTLGGKQQLVMEFGDRNGKNHRLLKYSLADLNKMAAALDRRKVRYGAGIKGVPVAEILKRAEKIDRQRAKSIAAATLYKFQGNLLSFRVTASGESDNAPSHYQVNIRLENWKDATNMEGQKYINKAKHAVMGRVSIDCNCGRYLYWFRYLATIGDFAVAPENVFPKIRNPKLDGCCCKHILKTLIVLQGPVLVNRIAKEMQNQAQSHLANSDAEKYLKNEQVKKLEQAGSIDNHNKSLQAFKKAMVAFKKTAADKEAVEAKKALKPKGKKAMLDTDTKLKAAETTAKKMSADLKSAHIGMLKTLKAVGMLTPDSDAINMYSKNAGIGKDALLKIAKDEGLL